MKQLFLDTNALIGEGLSSHSMLRLGRLAECGYVKIYLSEMVKREYLSNTIENKKSALDTAANKLKSCGKQLITDSFTKGLSEKLAHQVSDLSSSLEKRLVCEFDKWTVDLSVEILPIRTDILPQIIDDYFLGNGVYKTPKSRADIPDAIINESINELIEATDSLSVIIKDGAFKKHLDAVGKVTTFEKLSEFLESPQVKAFIDEIDSDNGKVSELAHYLSSDDFREKLSAFLNQQDELISSIYLERHELVNREALEVDSFGESVDFPIANSITNLELSDLGYLSDNTFTQRIDFETQATISYATDYGYVLDLENTDRDFSMSSMNGDGICEIHELIWVSLEGQVKITLGDNITLDSLRSNAQNIAESDGLIEIELDITKAHLHDL